MKLRRVFALVPDCHVPDWRYAGVWRRHFYDGLEQAGVTVIRPRDLDFAWARPPQTHDRERAAALDACRWMIDELKERVPIWKKEVTPQGDSWVVPHP